MNNLLLVEDDELYAQTLTDFLEETGFAVECAKSSPEALELSYNKNFDLYLLDISLKNSNGMELLRELRGHNDVKPAIFITSDPSSTTATKCFQIGCEDYIRKQCDISEILERIRLALKKNYPAKDCLINLTNGYVFDTQNKRLLLDGKDVDISTKECLLLSLLVKKRGLTATWDEISNTLWAPSEGASFTSVRVYIAALKKILGQDSIENIRGVGYKLAI